MPPPSLRSACLAAICTHSGFTGTKLALSLLALQLTDSPALVGGVLMAAALLPALLSPRLGRAVDRQGVGRVLPLCLGGLAAVGLALWALPVQVAVLLGAASLLGLGFNAFAVSLQKVVGALPPLPRQAGLTPPEVRKQNFGQLATASSVSAFAGPLLAGWGLDHLPGGAVFGLLAALPLLAGLLSRGWAVSGPAGLPLPAPPPAGALPRRAPVLLNRAMAPLAAAIVMLTLAGDALIILAPVIGRQQGLSATAVGAIVSALAVGSFAVRLASGWFIARLPEWRCLCFTLLASGAILLLCGQAGSVPVLMGLAGLLGAWMGLAQPMTQSLLHQAVPPPRVGEALGARLALVGGAQAAGPLLLGLGAQGLGTGPTLALAGLLLAATGWGLLRAAPPAPAQPEGAAP